MRMDDELGITAEQVRLLEMAIEGRTRKQMMDELQVSERTVMRWLALPQIRQELRKYRDIGYQRTVDFVSINSLNYAEVMHDLATDPKLHPAVRERASGKLLDFLGKSRDGDNAEKAAQLEEMMQDMKARGVNLE